MKQSKFGFTLVELLIVIALLGALAVGLLAALDPFEQLKKGTDTGIRNTTSEIQGAVIRYYAIKNHMPWCADDGTCPDGDPLSNKLTDGIISTMITNLTSAGELKSNFMDLADAYKNKIYITGIAADENLQVRVCFLPQAKSFRADPNTKYDATGIAVPAPVDCMGHGGAETLTCYWCIM